MRNNDLNARVRILRQKLFLVRIKTQDLTVLHRDACVYTTIHEARREEDMMEVLRHHKP